MTPTLEAAGESPAIERLVEVIGSEQVRRFAPDDDRSSLEVIRIGPLPLTAVSVDDVIELAYRVCAYVKDSRDFGCDGMAGRGVDRAGRWWLRFQRTHLSSSS